MGSCQTNPLLPPSWRCSISTSDARPFASVEVAEALAVDGEGEEDGGTRVLAGGHRGGPFCRSCRAGSGGLGLAGQRRGSRSLPIRSRSSRSSVRISRVIAADEPVRELVELEVGERARVEATLRYRRVLRRGRGVGGRRVVGRWRVRRRRRGRGVRGRRVGAPVGRGPARLAGQRGEVACDRGRRRGGEGADGGAGRRPGRLAGLPPGRWTTGIGAAGAAGGARGATGRANRPPAGPATPAGAAERPSREPRRCAEPLMARRSRDHRRYGAGRHRRHGQRGERRCPGLRQGRCRLRCEGGRRGSRRKAARCGCLGRRCGPSGQRRGVGGHGGHRGAEGRASRS